MTYLVDWNGTRIADDAFTLSLIGRDRPGAVLVPGCGSCASCTSASSSEVTFLRSTSNLYGLVEQDGDWVVSPVAGQGQALTQYGNDWSVSDEVVSGDVSVDMAPWFHESNPATGDFLGAIVTDMEGALNRATAAKVVEGVADGGWVTGLREGPREVRVKMTLLANSEAGLNAGQEWLAGIMSDRDRTACGGGVPMRFGVSCPGEAERFGLTESGQVTDRELVSCFMVAGPEVRGQKDSCGLWVREVEMAVLSERGKLMRPHVSHVDARAGTSGPGVVVDTPASVPALCEVDTTPQVMRDPSSPIPPNPAPELPLPGGSDNRTTFSHRKRVMVPVQAEPWIDRAIKITLHADGAIPGARVRVFHTSDYSPCGEVAEFYVQYIVAGYSLVVDGIAGLTYAWRGNEGNWAQASHLVRSIYEDGFFQFPVIERGEGFYVVVESQGEVDVSVESAVIS